jgi:hypothetical protein
MRRQPVAIVTAPFGPELTLGRVEIPQCSGAPAALPE